MLIRPAHPTPVGWLFNPLRGLFFWGVYNDVHYVKQALLRKTCLQYAITRYAGNYPVGVILYNKQVLRLRATATLNILHHQLGGTFDAYFRCIDA